MNRIKLKTGKSEILPISKPYIEEKTQRSPPYYQPDMADYPLAVCPVCDNPVKIIGLYKDIKPQPYATHYEWDVERLADFDEGTMRFCPYHDKRSHIDKSERVEKPTKITNLCILLLKEQFDRVVYILERITGIKISDKFADELMSEFSASKSYQYSWLTANNLPYCFGYMQIAKTLWGRLIRKDTPLWSELSKHEDIYLSPNNDSYQIRRSENAAVYFNLYFAFLHHKRKLENDIPIETVEFNVFKDMNGEKISIYRETIDIDETYFLNLILKKENESKRFRKSPLLDIANKYLPG